VFKSTHIGATATLLSYAFDRDTFVTVTPDHLGNPMMYNAEATQKAREITKAFLAEHLGK
jgi:hypothetical protein